MTKRLSQTQKDELFEMSNMFVNMTLNGEPARLYGKKLDFPFVAQINSNLKAEYAWETVKRIVENGGDFEI